MTGFRTLGRLPGEDRRTRRAMSTLQSAMYSITGDGISLTDGAFAVDLAIDPGLEFVAIDWATGTVYAVGDKVVETATTYICLVAHTSGTFATDLTAGKWGTTATSPLRVKIKTASGMIRDADGLSVDHDAADNFVANEHIDWTAATDSLVAGRVTINQTADENGLNIFGYDDVSASYAKIHVNFEGHTRIQTTGLFILSPSGGSPYIQLSHDGSNAKLYVSVGSFQFDSTILMADNRRLYFGTNSDSYIEFDGDSLNIICNAVTGTDDFVVQSQNFTLNSSGDLTITGQLGIGTAYSNTRAINALLTSGPGAATGLYAIRMKCIRTSAGTGTYPLEIFFAEPEVACGAGNVVDNVAGFVAKNVTETSGSVTNQMGLYIPSNFTSATNNYVLKNDSVALIYTLGDIYIHADSKKIFFGAADDASIYYSGSNLVLNPKDVGTGLVEVLGELQATNGTRVAQLADATYAGHFTDGTRTAYFCDGTYAAYFSNGTQTCYGPLSTAGWTIYSYTANHGLYVNTTVPGTAAAEFFAATPNGYVYILPATGYGVYSTLAIVSTSYLRASTYVESAKVKLTAEGGIAIKLTNKTGAASVAGNLVMASAANNDAAILTTNDVENCIGVIYNAGVADGSEMWVVVTGIADVLLEDNVGIARGDWVGAGDAGYAQVVAGSPPAAPAHFLEIGHCIETVAAGGAGTHVATRCVLHFN